MGAGYQSYWYWVSSDRYHINSTDPSSSVLCLWWMQQPVGKQWGITTKDPRRFKTVDDDCVTVWFQVAQKF